MLALTIKDRKQFTREMFIGELFDNFLLVKATIEHDITYDINGQLNSEFFDNDEREEALKEEYTSWSKVKPLIMSMIQGVKLPVGFNIVLKTTKKSLEILYNASAFDFSMDQVEGLFVNVIFKNEQMLITTGSSYSIFTMDKSLDHAFETAVKKLLTSKNIEYDE